MTMLVTGVFASGPNEVAASEATRFQLPNGLSGTVYGPEYLAERINVPAPAATRGILTLDDGTRLEVITTTDDPAVTNKGDERFHPFDTDVVLDLLRDIDCPHLQLDIEIYILPYPRADLLVSSTSGRRVYLSPHVIPIPRQRAAYTVAHEVGHVFHTVLLPDREYREWRSYRLLRGIDDSGRYSQAAAHAYQPKEIFAEDFRVLFGGPAAYHGGVVENPELPSPDDVAGLAEFFTRVARSATSLATRADVSDEPLLEPSRRPYRKSRKGRTIE